MIAAINATWSNVLDYHCAKIGCFLEDSSFINKITIARRYGSKTEGYDYATWRRAAGGGRAGTGAPPALLSDDNN